MWRSVINLKIFESVGVFRRSRFFTEEVTSCHISIETRLSYKGLAQVP